MSIKKTINKNLPQDNPEDEIDEFIKQVLNNVKENMLEMHKNIWNASTKNGNYFYKKQIKNFIIENTINR